MKPAKYKVQKRIRLKHFVPDAQTPKYPSLPVGWVEITHASGLPAYFHTETKTYTFARPFNEDVYPDARSSVPLTSVPFLYWRLLQGLHESQALDRKPEKPLSGTGQSPMVSVPQQQFLNVPAPAVSYQEHTTNFAHVFIPERHQQQQQQQLHVSNVAAAHHTGFTGFIQSPQFYQQHPTGSATIIPCSAPYYSNAPVMVAHPQPVAPCSCCIERPPTTYGFAHPPLAQTSPGVNGEKGAHLAPENPTYTVVQQAPPVNYTYVYPTTNSGNWHCVSHHGGPPPVVASTMPPPPPPPQISTDSASTANLSDIFRALGGGKVDLRHLPIDKIILTPEQLRSCYEASGFQFEEVTVVRERDKRQRNYSSQQHNSTRRFSSSSHTRTLSSISANVSPVPRGGPRPLYRMRSSSYGGRPQNVRRPSFQTPLELDSVSTGSSPVFSNSAGSRSPKDSRRGSDTRFIFCSSTIGHSGGSGTGSKTGFGTGYSAAARSSISAKHSQRFVVTTRTEN